MASSVPLALVGGDSSDISMIGMGVCVWRG